MKKTIRLIVFLFLAGTQFCFAQRREVSGRVTDASDGSPIAGATVIIKGTETGTATDANGKYTLKNVQPNAILVFSFIGMKTEEVNSGTRTVIDVKLESVSKRMEEVVVTALGISRKDKSLGYAVSSVKGDELVKARDANVVNSLAGRVAGIRVSTSSGTLGGASRIIIRGANSLDGNNQPLFVVDGIPIDNTTAGSASNNVVEGVADFGNRAGDINSDDIESISILKGAAATALYGARAKNGAVVIVTKKGKNNQKASVEFNSSIRFDSPLKLPEFQNEYAQGNNGIYDLKYSNGWGPKISDVADKKFVNFLGEEVFLQAYPDNVKNFYDLGKTYINSIAISGGNETGDYRLGMTALNQASIIPGMTMDKYTVSLNAGHKFSENFESRTVINYYSINSKGRPAQSSNNPNILTSAINGLPRTIDIELLKKHWQTETGEQIGLTTDKTGNNPYWIINKNRFKGDVERMILSQVFNYNPFPWLTMTNTFGIDFSNDRRKQVTSKGTFGALNGEFYDEQYYIRILDNNFIVTATKQLGNDWELKLMLGHNINDRVVKQNGVDAKELTIADLYVPSNAASKTPWASSSKKRLVGVYGDFGISYKDIIFFNITGRNDWSSTLPSNNRSYFYPGMSSSFVFSELLPENNILSFGNLRINWANVGSDENPYQLDYTFRPVTTYFSQYGLGGIFPHGGIATAFTVPRVLPNANLKPQNQNSFEIGTNLKFFNKRVTVDFTYYHVKTTDQILSLDVPLSTGYFAKKINIGSVSNRGIELNTDIVPVDIADFRWSINLNFAKNKQKVDKLVEDNPDMIYNLASGWSGLQIQAKKGESFGLYGTKWKRTETGEFIINSKSGLREVQKGQFIGELYPDWTMGFSNEFAYKGIQFSFLIDIRQGGVMYSSTTASLRSSGLAKETLENRGKIFIDKGVIPDGAGGYKPNNVPVESMQAFWGNYSAVANTEGNVFDASYVKLREVRLSYKFPRYITESMRIQGLEIGFEGRNLWIIKDHVPHVDPESNMFGPNSVAEGIEFNSVPTTRSLGFNIKLNF